MKSYRSAYDKKIGIILQNEDEESKKELEKRVDKLELEACEGKDWKEWMWFGTLECLTMKPLIQELAEAGRLGKADNPLEPNTIRTHLKEISTEVTNKLKRDLKSIKIKKKQEQENIKETDK